MIDHSRDGWFMTDAPSPPKTLSQQNTDIERWGWYSIGINVLLALINLAVALASGSLAVEAEMVHNIVDLFTAVGVLIGLKLSTRKSKTFPYGLYKIENVITVVLAVMTFVTAYEIAREALFAPAHVATVNAWMLVGVVLATAVPLVFSHFELRAGRAANSPALIADAKEYRAHVFTTGVVLASLVSQWFNVPLDRVAALIIVLAIGKTGWELLTEGMRVLLDASLDADTLLAIREILDAESTVADVKWVTGHNAGRYRFVEAEIALRVKDLSKAEASIRRAEAEIRKAVPHIERVLIHAEPVQRTHWRYALPLADSSGTLSEHFGEAPYFALVRVRRVDGAVEEQQTLANPFLPEERAKGIQVAEWLVKQKADVVVLKESLRGKGPVYVFSDAGIEMRTTSSDTLAKAIDEQHDAEPPAEWAPVQDGSPEEREL
jgi:cation diffusion facilitator family transporter